MKLKRIFIAFLIISNYCIYGQRSGQDSDYLLGAARGDTMFIPESFTKVKQVITPITISSVDSTRVVFSGSITDLVSQINMIQKWVDENAYRYYTERNRTVPQISVGSHFTVVASVQISCNAINNNVDPNCWVQTYSEPIVIDLSDSNKEIPFKIRVYDLVPGATYTINQKYSSYYLIPPTINSDLVGMFTDLNFRTYKINSNILRIGNNPALNPKENKPLVFKALPLVDLKITNNYLLPVSQLSCKTPQYKGDLGNSYWTDPITGSIPQGGKPNHLAPDPKYGFIWQVLTSKGWEFNLGNSYSGPPKIGSYSLGGMSGYALFDTASIRRVITTPNGSYSDTSNVSKIIFISNDILNGSGSRKPALRLTETGLEGNSPILRFTTNYPSALAYYSITDTDVSTNTSTTYTTMSNSLKIPNTQNASNHVYAISALFEGTCPMTKPITIYVTPPDGDGNIYPAVKIGYQYWMIDNLRATRFNDGTPIKTVQTKNNKRCNFSWYYNDSVSYAAKYGALYNNTVIQNENKKNVCPVGWKPAGYNDWMILFKNNEGMTIANELKSLTGWNMKDVTNPYYFSAKPSGEKDWNGNYLGEGIWAIWWAIMYSGDPDLPSVGNHSHKAVKLLSADKTPLIIKPADQNSIRCVGGY